MMNGGEESEFRKFVRDIPSDEIWSEMSPQERLAHLQAFENAMAKETGRDPIRLAVLPPEIMMERPGVVGAYVDELRVIFVNPRFLVGKLKMRGVSYFNYQNALDLVAHEGRHAWQHFVVRHPERKLVDEKTRLAILLNTENYCSDPPMYSGQLIERDARLFAKDVMGAIDRTIMEETGNLDTRFMEAVAESERDEWHRTRGLDRVSEADISAWERQARVNSARKHPGIDFSGISAFDEVKKLKKDYMVIDYVLGKPIGDGFRPDKKVGTADGEKTDGAKVGRTKPEREERRPGGKIGRV